MIPSAQTKRIHDESGLTSGVNASPNHFDSWDSPDIRSGETYRLISLFAPAPVFDVWEFLLGAYGQERFFWSEPMHAGSFTLSGVGIAAEIRIAPILDTDGEAVTLPGYRFEEVADRARQLFINGIFLPADAADPDQANSQWLDHPARPRLFGGFAFQDDFVPDNTWSTFSPAQFVLPHFQYVQSGADSYLTITALVSLQEDLGASLKGLREALMTRLASRCPFQHHSTWVTDLRFPMSPEAWRHMVQNATSEIQQNYIEKVVLSRVCEVRTDQPIDAATILPYLEEYYGDCYRFIFEPVPNHGFFGASPELLIHKSGDHVRTMALAGSAPRHSDEELDAANARELLLSEKDRHEHQLVVDSIITKLESHADTLSVPAIPTILKLRNIQHLLTPITGRLLDSSVNILALIRLLHPTPAMGGVPAERALAFLRRAEPIPRGWYAAPIGWLDAHNEGVFAVAIRSAVTQQNRAWLYSGAGIVSDSNPEKEWTETALKFRPMLGALGVEGAG